MGAVLAVTLVLGWASGADAAEGRIRCEVMKNGASATGTIAVKADGRTVVSGSCAKTLVAPTGNYQATVHLDGTLDQPSKTMSITVSDSALVPVRAEFHTGVLEVRVVVKDRRGTSVVIVKRGSKRVGTMPHGVAVHLSEGKYDVVVQYAGREQVHPIHLKSGQRRLVRAQF